MPIEIERKFLVSGDGYREGRAVRIVQGYICSSPDKVVRVRIKGNEAFLTIKDATVGFARHEFEYAIPVADAEVMLENICGQPIIDKTRWITEYDGHVWEVDEFHRENEGLIVAEIELNDAAEQFALPPWVDREVTGQERYYNACLFAHPYSMWTDAERNTTPSNKP